LLNSIKRFWNEHPLLAIILIALIPRLVAVVFSKGFGMHDDHFEVIEQPFIIMHDITFWTNRGEPEAHSIVYPSVQYILLNGLEAIDIHDPQTQMYLIRLVHAVYSLLIVFFGFKIAEILTNRQTAKKTGLILALFWVLPFLSVRNLIEVVCIPPLMAGFYYTLTSKSKIQNALIAGLCFGLSFAFRYQIISIAGTLGLVLIYRKEFKQAALLGFGFILSAVTIQGGADIFAWGYPFASFIKYLQHNFTHSGAYTTGPWYNYIILVLGAFIPPTSFLLIYGLFRKWKNAFLILLPILVFFVLHSIFPNKQERFILPVIPLILTLGICGWEDFVDRSKYWLEHKVTLKAFWVWFWTVNTILLLLFSTYYTKKSRIEAMYSLYRKPVSGLILVSGKFGAIQPPLFYTGRYPVPYFQITNDEQLNKTKVAINNLAQKPNYVIFFGAEDLDKRIQQIESLVGFKLVLERRVEPSLLDYIFYKLNPKHNKNETAFLFKAGAMY
jgi:hypothetical protein